MTKPYRVSLLSLPVTPPETRGADVLLDAYADHATRHGLESGADGDLVFMPYGAGERPTRQRVRDHKDSAWRRSLAVPGWVRTWALWSGDEILGHADLTGGPMPAALHRCWLGMGLERAARGQGYGRLLLDTLIDWAVSRPEIAWIDLGVFAHNTRARRLYRSVGFVETSLTTDRFRVDGQRIDDVQMTLDLDAL